MRIAAALMLAVCVAGGPVLAQCKDPTSESGRFAIRGVELIDKKTKLVWLRCAAGYVPTSQCDSSAVLPTQKYESLRQPIGGPGMPKGDWRIPTADEWETIVARNCAYIVEPKHIEIMFEKVWTATPAGRDQVYMIAEGGKRVPSPRTLASNEFAQGFYVRNARADDLTPAPAPAASPPVAGATALAQAASPTYSKAQLQKMYMDYLSAEGFRPELTPAGNVMFRREGRFYLVYADEKDPTYFRLTLTLNYDDKGPEARAARVDASNSASEQTKVAKAFVTQEAGATFSIEMFLVVPGDFKSAMPRSLRAIDFAVDKYRARLAELGKGG
jgi:hypothetical protein